MLHRSATEESSGHFVLQLPRWCKTSPRILGEVFRSPSVVQGRLARLHVARLLNGNETIRQETIDRIRLAEIGLDLARHEFEEL
jgi:hypothetical protein